MGYKKRAPGNCIMPIRCITFNKESQRNLPSNVKSKIKKNMQKSKEGFTQHLCTDCKRYSWLHEKDRDGITLGYCTHCGHPIWE